MYVYIYMYLSFQICGKFVFFTSYSLSNCSVSSRIILDLFVLRWSIVSAHNQDLLKRI